MPLVQELAAAGRDALWRSAAGYRPGLQYRFSTYALAAILNAMRDALSDRRRLVVGVPREGAAAARRVHAAARALQRRRQQEQGEPGEAQAQQQQPLLVPHPRLDELAAAARLPRRSVLSGLAAGRPQLTASLGTLVPYELAGTGRCNQSGMLVAFGDMPEAEEAS